MQWQGPHSELARQLEASNSRTLNAYRASPVLIFEAANIERATAQGGYSRRQLYELIQNGADAIHEGQADKGALGGRISIILAGDCLYCANEGEAIDERGLVALLSSHISEKRGAEIGRFGLGFKSVLGVTNAPEFFSRTVSFRFDRDWSHELICTEVPDIGKNPDDRTPILRLAEPIDPIAYANSDPILAELMGWATTVVKIPLEGTDAKWLPEDLRRFPAEFLLFSPHVSEVRLENRDTYVDRRIQLEIRDGLRVLTDADDSTEWKAFEIPGYEPSKEAREDAGELAHRDSVPLIWAVPRVRKRDRGQFWAFFPTEYETTLKGILNAPWKTNEDRQNLLPGTFNEELLSVFADMVIENLDSLLDPEDPGSFLELLPGRGRETYQNWADEILTRHIYERAYRVPSLPDQNGTLQKPASMKIHPRQATAAALEAWSSHPDRPVGWCHRSIIGDTRRSRALRLLESAKRGESTVKAWLEAVAKDESVSGSSAAIRTAAILKEADSRTERAIAQSYIVLTADNELSCPDPDRLYFARTYVAASNGVYYVHPELAADPQVRNALENLGIREADELGEFRALVAQGLSANTDWEAFWRLAEQIDVKPFVEVTRRSKSQIRVRTIAGAFKPIRQTWLPGPIVPEDGSRDAEFAIDVPFHQPHRILFDVLELRTAPSALGGHDSEHWFKGYRREQLAGYLEMLTTMDRERLPSTNPVKELLAFDQSEFTGPLETLDSLSEDGCVALTMAALEALPDEAWHMRHNNPGYPEIEVPRPDLWWIARSGAVATSLGVRSPGEAVSPALGSWSEFLPVFEGSEAAARKLDLPDRLEDITNEQWAQAFLQTLESDHTRAAADFYAVASDFVDPPPEIQAWVGSSTSRVAPADVTVVTEREELAALKDEGVPAIAVDSHEKAKRLIRMWALRAPKGRVSTEILHVPASIAEPVIDRYPDLSLVLSPEQGAFELQACESIERFTLTARGRSPATRLERYRDDSAKRLLYSSDLDEYQILDFVSQTFGLDLDRDELEGIIQNSRSDEALDRLRTIAQMPEESKRLVALAGGEAIKRRLPRTLIETVSQDGGLDDVRAARFFLASYGTSSLKVLQEDIRDRGFPAPSTWSGSRAARKFVELVGFPEEYAGHPQRRREPVLTVHGPTSVPKMHDFQRQIADAAGRLLRHEGGTKALLSLPTGAGKTRVAVESIVEAFHEGAIGGPVLWVAQTDELCEQAVQTWAYLWRAIGRGEELHISRLWSQNSAHEVDEGPQVVVATIAKLDAIKENPSYEWLSKTECLIIDEAHAATTRPYTRLLDWVGIQRNERVVPLIGLTATPFRGTSESETQRLVNRFGGWRLDEGVFGPDDPYSHLQDIGVLAKVDHRLLEGSTIQLSDSELERLRQTRRLPPEVEARVGSIQSRNTILLDSIEGLPENWPVLLFASSVDHAQTMAALLTDRGISSASISATTEAGARRHYVESFRRGDIRVLTNYGVLAQGFDAPATRAVYVARPTFSPNVYQQMIGRGLRGPLNGGKDVCLIVNVADNVAQFGEALAFTEFEYLWNRDR